MEKIYDQTPKYYVYYLKNPLKDKIFYVGKGTGNRCKQHLTDKNNYCFNKRLNGYIRKLLEANIKPEIIILQDNLEEEESYILEESEIKRLGRIGFEENGCLLNILDSGRPPRYQKENHPWWGRKHTEETKKKISQKKKENFLSGKIKVRSGHHLSEETKEKISIANTGRKRSKESIEKTRQAHLGRPQTEYQKQKVREFNSKKWLIITPEGKEEIITNLNAYCKENNLSSSNLSSVASGKLNHYKGYKALRISQ